MVISVVHKDGVDFFIPALYHCHKRGGEICASAHIHPIGWDRNGSDRRGTFLRFAAFGPVQYNSSPLIRIIDLSLTYGLSVGRAHEPADPPTIFVRYVEWYNKPFPHRP